MNNTPPNSHPVAGRPNPITNIKSPTAPPPARIPQKNGASLNRAVTPAPRMVLSNNKIPVAVNADANRPTPLPPKNNAPRPKNGFSTPVPSRPSAPAAGQKPKSNNSSTPKLEPLGAEALGTKPKKFASNISRMANTTPHPPKAGGKPMLIVLIFVPTLIVIGIVIYFLSSGNGDDQSGKYSRVTCPQCHKFFNITKEDEKTNSLLTCPNCKNQFFRDENNAISRARDLVNKADGLVTDSENYTQSDPQKEQRILEDATKLLDDALAIYTAIPSVQGTSELNKMGELRKLIRTKRRLH